MNITEQYLIEHYFLQVVENRKTYYMKNNFILTEDPIYGWSVMIWVVASGPIAI